ncbi:ribonuclease H2, subunit C [Lasiosphaeris hirsuta]|uniref:Ribonuclease H2, subunit C n=1 Tax=Lasiosphaeris hirsuta TaxID=260670 RepID=A0AA40AF99_9PEZI|nr:ribonuclease H2, subunit C [Lasiosphaeris hirsuta]
MSTPILTLKSSDQTAKTTPHLLPCRVHHTGPVDPVEAFWEPKQGDDGTTTAYFRGRKLHGKSVKLPKDYRGVVAAPAPKGDEKEKAVDFVDVDAESGKTASLNVQAEFDEMVIWGHEAVADTADPYVRGMEEWLALADQIHGFDEGKRE